MFITLCIIAYNEQNTLKAVLDDIINQVELETIPITIPKGTKVANYGYYSVSNGCKWLYVQFTYKNVTYTGFASSTYLRK